MEISLSKAGRGGVRRGTVGKAPSVFRKEEQEDINFGAGQEQQRIVNKDLRKQDFTVQVTNWGCSWPL